MRPRYYRKSSKDELDTVREVYEDLVYKPSWFKLIPKNIKTVIDIGALIGSFTIWAHEQWPKAVIHSFEPDPASFKILLKNIAAASAQKQVKAYKSAVWKNQKPLKLNRFENTSGSNSVVFRKRPFIGSYQESILVPTSSLSTILKKIRSNIDFLKVDCEGAEYDILYSLSKRELKKIKRMAIEYHEFDKNSKHRGVVLSNFLRKAGFVTQIIPTNIRKGQCLGYIYASNIKVEMKLNKIFDNQTDQLTNLHRLATQREEYAKEYTKKINVKK